MVSGFETAGHSNEDEEDVKHFCSVRSRLDSRMSMEDCRGEEDDEGSKVNGMKKHRWAYFIIV